MAVKRRGFQPFPMRPFCLQLEASCLQWRLLLTVHNYSFFTYSWSFFVSIFHFQLELFCLHWESASSKGLKGLYAKKLNCKQKKAPTVSEKASSLSFNSTQQDKSATVREVNGTKVEFESACASARASTASLPKPCLSSLLIFCQKSEKSSSGSQLSGSVILGPDLFENI